MGNGIGIDIGIDNSVPPQMDWEASHVLVPQRLFRNPNAVDSHRSVYDRLQNNGVTSNISRAISSIHKCCNVFIRITGLITHLCAAYKGLLAPLRESTAAQSPGMACWHVDVGAREFVAESVNCPGDICIGHLYFVHVMLVNRLYAIRDLCLCDQYAETPTNFCL